MAYSLSFHNLSSILPALTKCCKNQTLALTHSQFHHSNPFLKLKKPSLLSSLWTRKLRAQKPRSSPLVFAAQSNNVKVLQIVWNVGKDGIEAGTNLVPASVPRPVARISVTVVALAISLFVLKDFSLYCVLCAGYNGICVFYVHCLEQKIMGQKGMVVPIPRLPLWRTLLKKPEE